MEKLYQIIDSSRIFDKNLAINSKLLLVDNNWNDYGYYTRYQIFSSKERVKLADLCIMNIGQEVGEPTDFSQSFITFICDVNSAYFLFLYLSDKERRTLSEQLNITYDNDKVHNEPAYCHSVIRGTNGPAHNMLQAKIKKIMTSNLDITHTLSEERERVHLLFK